MSLNLEIARAIELISRQINLPINKKKPKMIAVILYGIVLNRRKPYSRM